MNLFESAEYAESLSECKKRQCGFSLEVNGEIVSLGFNHGNGEECKCRPTGQENPDCDHAEIHGMRHIEFLSSDYVRAASTYICCLNCCKEMVKRGVNVLFYRDHRFEPEKQKGIEFLKLNNVEVLNEWSN